MRENKSVTYHQIYENFSKLIQHVKKYNKGAFPLVYLSTQTAINPKDLIELTLRNIYEIDEGKLRVRTSLQDKRKNIYLFREDQRMELAWYIIYRLPVVNVREEDFLIFV